MRTFPVATVRFTAFVFAILTLVAATAMAGSMAGPEEGLVTLEEAEGWFVSVAYGQSDRELRFDNRVTPVELSRITAATGVDVLPFLTLRAEAGSAGMEVGLIESSSGFEWGIGARAALWDFIIEGTPALPRRHAVRVEVDVAYREASMKLEGVYFGTTADPASALANTDEYLKWSELTVSPLIRYTHNRATESVWNRRMPTGVSAYIGPYYSDWDIDHAPLAGKGNNDFGMRLGADLRIANGWLVQLDAVLYDGTDDSYSIGMGYYF
ncbi:MAG: hypothetical protein ISS31_01880 [Kiritimatiellae bacterium]|nr:hypothetical protein [Kiritimatiellia bacterium]